MSSVSLPWDEQGGQPQNINHVMENDEALAAKINGNLDADNLDSSVRALLGLTGPGAVRRGKSIIATEESRTNVAYGKLTTPDQVAGIALPTDGLLCVAYSALWKNSVSQAGRAAIFIGANQLKVPSANGGAALVDEPFGNSTINVYSYLHTSPLGLDGPVNSTTDATLATTGIVIATSGSVAHGSVAVIHAAAGTYDISVQFKSASGSVTVKDRKLWVWTLGF